MQKMSNFKKYFIGFIVSLLLTIAAFVPVMMHVNYGHKMFTHENLIIYILILAIVQLVVQMFLFLQLGSGPKPRLNMITFWVTMSIVMLVVVASIWIMDHLNYNMSPEEINTYLKNSDSF